MSLVMTRPEREAFLADLHVGVISIPDPGRGPLTAPIWYAYEPGGELHVLCGRSSRKGKLLEVGTRLSLVAQTEQPPYKYVSVEGAVIALDPVELEKHMRPMAHRYLGKELGDQYVGTPDAESLARQVLVRVRPERWLSTDYAKLGS